MKGTPGERGGAQARAGERRLRAATAAAMFAAAGVLAIAQNLLQSGEDVPIGAGLAALGLGAALLGLGPRIPSRAMIVIPYVAVAVLGGAHAASDAPPDSAALYFWPVVWTAYFFGRTALAALLTTVVVVNTLVLTSGSGATLNRWLSVTVSLVVTAAVVRLLTERNKQLTEYLQREARIDPLTELLNRRGLEDRAAVEIERARREGTPISVVALDIDHFKRVNDEHGHETGDRVLARIASRMRGAIRGIDVVARVGGEEFVVLLPACDPPTALAVAERIRAAAAARPIEPIEKVTLSAGVATTTAAELQLEELLRRADEALYLAKRSGRDRTVVANRDLAEPLQAGTTRVAAGGSTSSGDDG